MILINAFKSISRTIGRNILIGVIVLVIAISSCVALAIRSAAQAAKEDELSKLTITGSIIVDMEKVMEEAQAQFTPNSEGEQSSNRDSRNSMRNMLNEYTGLSLEEMQKYADSDYVNEFYYTATSSLNATEDFAPYSLEEEADEEDEAEGEQQNEMGMSRGDGPSIEGEMAGGGRFFVSLGGVATGDFTIEGVSETAAMDEFISGDSQIIKDESNADIFSETDDGSYYCLISNELAVFNNVSVGDSIVFSNPEVDDEEYILKVAGIYKNTTTSATDSRMMMSTAMDPANKIYMSYASLKEIVDHSVEVKTTSTDEEGDETSTELNITSEGTYIFKSQEDYESFEAEIREKGLADTYKLTSTDYDSFKASLVPLENLESFALTLLLIILGVGAVILIVINIFNIRERKYEVGVLTAIGIKKWKVASQFVTELLTITLIAIIIGTIVGAFISVPVSESLLEMNVSAAQAEQESVQQNFGGAGGPMGNFSSSSRTPNSGGSGPVNIINGFNQNQEPVEYLDQINAVISLNILGQLIGIGMLLTLISSFAAIVFILRYEPLKILANRA